MKHNVDLPIITSPFFKEELEVEYVSSLKIKETDFNRIFKENTPEMLIRGIIPP